MRRSPPHRTRTRRRLRTLPGAQEPPAAQTLEVAPCGSFPKRPEQQLERVVERADVPAGSAPVRRARQPRVRVRALHAARDDADGRGRDARVGAASPAGGPPRLTLVLPRAELPPLRRARRGVRRKGQEHTRADPTIDAHREARRGHTGSRRAASHARAAQRLRDDLLGGEGGEVSSGARGRRRRPRLLRRTPRRRHRRARRPPGYAHRSAHRRPGGLEQVHELGT